MSVDSSMTVNSSELMSEIAKWKVHYRALLAKYPSDADKQAINACLNLLVDIERWVEANESSGLGALFG